LRNNTNLIFVLSLMLLTSCGLLSPTDTVVLSTNEAVYTINSSLNIQLDVVNHRDTDIYYICTGQIYLQEFLDGEMINTWLVHGFEDCLTPVSLEKGSSHTFEIDLGRQLDLSLLSAAYFDEQVSYRLVADFYTSSDFRNLLDFSERSSNAFQIIQN